MVTKRQLAKEAICIEQDLIKENVGSQDQVAASFGGLNKIEFGGDKEFYAYPITLSKRKIDLLQGHLMLFFTGFPRNASDIAREQIKKIPDKKRELQIMMLMVEEAINTLNGESDDISDFGKLLHESWKIKRGLTDLISTSRIDEIYEAAISAGAIGGKLLGAGGGGFILFFVPPGAQPSVKEKLKNLLYVPFYFESLGTQVVMYTTQDFY
jgi:D-glycero-alpha-D-manno-heptose-7-phosphate kinase